AIPTPLFKAAVTDVDDLMKLTFNRRVVEIPCPKCGGKLKPRQWLFSSGKSCKTISSCEADGEFLIKLKAARVTDNNYTVTRSVFEASEDDISAYNEKLKKREERKKRAQSKTEEKNEKNGDV
ncbi:MAG: hypothetical protein K2J77_09840, partial [Oscillospiraceae bacterium]|nr:hypothetical protein [Oscillospiraceae bacterium]